MRSQSQLKDDEVLVGPGKSGPTGLHSGSSPGYNLDVRRLVGAA